MTYQLIHNDILKWAASYTGPKFHSLFCDPPYHLTITKRFGKPGSAPAKHGKDGAFSRASKGFMGQAWDGGEIAFNPETWAALGEHLHDGGFGMAFASSRGWHRLAVAIEDAGFIIHPSIFGWVTLSSFPKATRVTYRGGGNSPFCECDDSPQLFRGHGFPNNAPDEMSTIEDSQDDYPLFGDSNGEQLRPASSTFQGSGPSLDDALEHNHSSGPSVETHQDSEPLHSPSQAQCIAHLSRPDSSHPLPTDLALLQLQVSGDESDSVASPIASNDPDSKREPSQFLETSESDTSEFRKCDNGNLAYNSLSGSSVTPFSEIHRDDTTKGEFCQKCGKVKEEAWEGHRYGLQALKNAVEPIIVFQKPYTGRPVDNITATGAGALNIEVGRIGLQGIKSHRTAAAHQGNGTSINPYFTRENQIEREQNGDNPRYDPLGRWPANLLLDESGAALLDRQSGIRPAGSALNGNEPSQKNRGVYEGGWNREAFEPYDDSGGASRMFFQSHWQYEILEQLENADPLRYEPKVSTAEREAGLDDLPERLRHRVNSGGLENEPRFAPVKLKNHHPTLKPISLTKYLTTLLLPPDAYAPRRILVPFAGAGSEMIGAILAGWDEIIGIEKGVEYTQIAEARLKWWSQWPGWGQTEVDKILASLAENVPAEQLSLFEAAQ